jgi:ABC-type Na+ efflux pump permease subunit
MLNSRLSPLWIIATKDIRDALRDHFVLIVTLFLSLAAL